VEIDSVHAGHGIFLKILRDSEKGRVSIPRSHLSQSIRPLRHASHPPIAPSYKARPIKYWTCPSGASILESDRIFGF
jgi:hypothetical protein